jgi:uncharacterized protein (TIGR03118 family)
VHPRIAVRQLGIGATIVALALVAAGPAAARPAKRSRAYVVHKLVSDVAGAADNMDKNLVNAWGLAAGPGTPWWVSDNGTDKSTLYNASGMPLPLVVSVPGAPTGLVFNGTANAFVVGASNALFIFDTEGGTILGWNMASGTAATVKVDESSAGDVYKGLAIADTASGPRLYATDFHNGAVDVFDSSWQPVKVAGAFTDARLPARYAPFGIQAIGDRIFVTYAKRQAGSDDEAHGRGLGFVDVFDTAGKLLGRVARHGALNAPWGIAKAPAGFGAFSRDLLVGNFGDGTVHAYKERHGRFTPAGTLRTAKGHKLRIDGLWALEFGHGTTANGPTDSLFFTAGPNDEKHGLFGTIRAR